MGNFQDQELITGSLHLHMYILFTFLHSAFQFSFLPSYMKSTFSSSFSSSIAFVNQNKTLIMKVKYRSVADTSIKDKESHEWP